MAEDDRTDELEGRMQRVDKLIPSPNDRASRLWEKINPCIKEVGDEIGDYDMLCLCIEMAASLANGNYAWAVKSIKVVAKDLYLFHYYVFAEQELNDDKESTIISNTTNPDDNGTTERGKDHLRIVESDREGEDTQHSKDE